MVCGTKIVLALVLVLAAFFGASAGGSDRPLVGGIYGTLFVGVLVLVRSKHACKLPLFLSGDGRNRVRRCHVIFPRHSGTTAIAREAKLALRARSKYSSRDQMAVSFTTKQPSALQLSMHVRCAKSYVQNVLANFTNNMTYRQQG